MSLPAGVVLAGGRGSRMGGVDKASLILGGRRLIDHALDRLRPQAGALAISANGEASRFAALGSPVLPDAESDYAGPLAGILAAMDWAAGIGADRLVTVPVDSPFFPLDLAARLESARAEAGAPIALAAMAEPGGGVAPHPVFGLWSTDLREDLRAALATGERRVRAWAGRHGAVLAIWPAGGADPFFNLNRPEDLAAAELRLKEARS